MVEATQAQASVSFNAPLGVTELHGTPPCPWCAVEEPRSLSLFTHPALKTVGQRLQHIDRGQRLRLERGVEHHGNGRV